MDSKIKKTTIKSPSIPITVLKTKIFTGSAETVESDFNEWLAKKEYKYIRRDWIKMSSCEIAGEVVITIVLFFE